MTTEVKCPHIPDVKLVSGAQWEDAYDPHVKPVTMGRIPLPMPTSTWNSLRMAAAQNFDREVCGFITSSWQLNFITNVHQDFKHNFRMHEQQYADAIKRIYASNEQVLGVFHTHPSNDPRPSYGDIQGWPNKDLHWRYWIATAVDVFEWEYVNQP